MARIEFSHIDLLVLDVDGVLTDGRIILTPDGQEIKSFDVRDGAGMKYWKRMGKKLAIISGRGSQAIHVRAGELDVDTLRVNAKDKLPAYREVLDELGVSEDRTAVVGDDLPDIPLLKRCLLPIATGDAVEEVRAVAAYVTKQPGGRGAVREAIELILKQSGRWPEVMARYLGEAGKENR
jgi:3-deoxy-D-manno-octulosonate 8-phosphate phosphatase (KDO 8-P phosphatase)